jgi:hypothetical protein
MEELIIYLLAVFTPMLANRIMKMIMINVETMPPVVVVYSLSPLYRSSLLLGKRSTALKVPVAQEKNVID